MDSPQQKAYDDMMAALQSKELGTAPDGTPISGILFSFMNGAHRAVLNIVEGGSQIENGIKLLEKEDPDLWEQGHNAVFEHYLKFKGPQNEA